jgi:hypothetical protein
MRILPTPTVVSSLIFVGLIGTLPAAGQSIQPTHSTASIRMASVADSAADKETYLQKVRDEMQEWQRKQHDFREKARTKASADNIATRNNFNAAWARAEAASHKLMTAGAADWQSAKSSFEKASQKLAAVWRKIGTQDK